jgi:hypothetical protein
VPELDVDTISSLGHLNYIEFGRFLARCSGREGTILEEGGMVFHAPRSSFPVLFNGAWRVDGTLDAEEAVARADAFFGARARGYSINLRDGFAEDVDLRDAAESAGLVALLHAPEMVCWQPVESRARLADVELRWIRDQETLDAFLEVNESAYTSLGMPTGAIAEAVTDLASFAAQPVGVRAAMSSGLSSMAAAATFSSRWVTDDVPGIGTITGERCNSQARASCDGVTPCRSAAEASADTSPLPTGAHGMKASPRWVQASRTGSASRAVALYRFWTDTMVATADAASSWATVTFESPRWRILPWSCSSLSAPTDSSIGTCGSTRWNW